MSLQLLALLVVFGIGGIVALVHLTGGSRGAELTAAEKVAAAWRSDWPGQVPVATMHNAAGTTALVTLDDGARGLIWSFGADTVSRRLVPGAVQSITPRDGSLHVRFAAFDCPAVNISLTPAELPEWHRRLAPLVET